MEEIYLKDVYSSWGKVGHNFPASKYELELTIIKKMLDIIQVGSFYHFIFTPASKEIIHVSDSIRDVLGYKKEEFTTAFLLSRIHPDDLPYFIDFERTVVAFKIKLPPDKLLKYKTRYDYRLKKKDGSYIRVLQQSITIKADETGRIIQNFVVHTDISHLKTDTEMKLSFIGMDGEDSFIDVRPNLKYIPSKQSEIFTDREKQVLILLAQNKSTKEISKKLKISAQTVSTHRKNIHKKAHTCTVLELVRKATKENWI